MQTLTSLANMSFLSATTHPLTQDETSQAFWLHPFAQYIGGKKQLYTAIALGALFPPNLVKLVYQKLYTRLYLNLKSKTLLRKTLFGEIEVYADLRDVKRVELLLKENKYFGQYYEVAVRIQEGETQRRLTLLVFEEFAPACELSNLLLEWAQEKNA